MKKLISITNYIKRMGLIKICELCNWDLRDIREHIIRVTHIDDSRLSTQLRKFKALFAEKTEIYRKDPRIIEIMNKLKGD